MNGSEFSHMLDFISYYCDGRRKFKIRLEYFYYQKELVVEYENLKIVNCFHNVSLSNIRQLLNEINKSLRNDKGFEKLKKLNINY